MSVRMVPFASQAERLYRIVRQTAKDWANAPTWKSRGASVELDRSFSTRSAPLEHLLRNAVAHGLESREVRTPPRSPIGEISLTWHRKATKSSFTMADGGSGSTSSASAPEGPPLRPAWRRRSLPTTRLIELSSRLVSRPPSRNHQIAGRGIGMDVVKTEVAEPQRTHRGQSPSPAGTTFRPLSCRWPVTKGPAGALGNHQYAIPSSMIEQVLELKDKPCADRSPRPARPDGKRYPFRFLPHLLGETNGAAREASPVLGAAVARRRSRRLQVDECSATAGNRRQEHRPAARPRGRHRRRHRPGDGQVVLILNPGRRCPPLRRPGAAKPRRHPTGAGDFGKRPRRCRQ